MLRGVTLVLLVVAIAMFTFAPSLLASNSQSPAEQDSFADNAAENSGSLEFVVTSVIGRALNVPGTY